MFPVFWFNYHRATLVSSRLWF